MRINYSVRERRWLCWLAGARPVFACMQASSPSKPRQIPSLWKASERRDLWNEESDERTCVQRNCLAGFAGHKLANWPQ